MHYLYELLQKLMVIYLQDSACYRSTNFTAPITTPTAMLRYFAHFSNQCNAWLFQDITRLRKFEVA
jgi:hypothetical protein